VSVKTVVESIAEFNKDEKIRKKNPRRRGEIS
jgi:hypothetical protein